MPFDEIDRPFRVLSLDGGGMRGLYTSFLLDRLSKNFSNSRDLGPCKLDVGKGFDLIVGTSTGGIIACGLAVGLSTDQIISLYKETGRRVFQHPMPQRPLPLFMWLARHLTRAANDSAPFTAELREHFGDTTLRQVYEARGIALCIPSVDMKTQRSWVFKTPHDHTRQRGADYQLVDVCLATCAAPLYFPLACVNDPLSSGSHHAFVDGGLWANNPVIIAQVEALEIAGPGRQIDLVSVSTCVPPSGEPISPKCANWGVMKWQAGSKALLASLCAQSSRYTGMAKVLTEHLSQPVRVLRLEASAPSPEQARHMNLDCTTDESISVLSDLARIDAERYYDSALDCVGDMSGGKPQDTTPKAGRRADDFSILWAAFSGMPATTPEASLMPGKPLFQARSLV